MADTEKKRLPASLEAEQSTLGGVLIKPEALADVSAILRTDDFFFPGHREIFDSMATVTAAGAPLDIIAVADDLRKRGMLSRLDDGEVYLLKLMTETPTAENVMYYATLVHEKAQLRRLIAACTEIAARAYGDFGEFEPFMQEAEAQVAAVVDGGERDDDPVRLGDVIDDVLDVVEKQSKDPDAFYVRTGVTAYNEKIGGNRRGHLIVVAALPGDGKTSWMFDVALWSAEKQHIPNLIFSMEMPIQEIGERGLGIFSLIETRKIHRGAVVPEDWKHLNPAGNRIRPLPIYICDKRMGFEQIESISRRWAKEVRRDLPPGPDGLPALLNISIDYLQIAKRSSQKGRTDESIIAEATSACKGMAKELMCPVTLLSQLTKLAHEKDFDGNRKKPEKKDLKGSGAIEADADVIVMPFHEAEMPDDHRTGHKLMRSMLIVEKCRGGATGEIPAIYNKSIMSFQDDRSQADFDSALVRTSYVD